MEKKINKDVYDIIIIGGGPAGLTAGLYAARGRMNALLIESLGVMGQATMTDEIENYPGIDRTTGYDLVAGFKKQAQKFGLKCAQGTVQNITRQEDNGKVAWIVEDEGNIYAALSVIVASGAASKKLEVPGEKEFIGSGVSYCATCDAAFFREKEIVVVGGGDTAVEEALFLTKFGKRVKLIHRRDRLRATKIVQERAFANEKMSFVWDSVVVGIEGKHKVEKIIVKNVKTEEKSEIPCDGVFIFVGWQPNTGFVKDLVESNKIGAIIVDLEMKTSEEGIFGAGDCCHKLLHQVITACGDGATAAFAAQHYVERIKGTEYV